MQKLWAPWRVTYITAPQPGGCFLCRAWEAADEAGHYVLSKGNLSFVLLNLYPYNSGHLMVATARHVGGFDEAGAETRAQIMEMVNTSVKALTEAYSPDGFNIGFNLGKAAGAGVADHLHVHVVPRWSGDTNCMPILSDVKVISEHIDATYSKLRAIYRKL